MGEVDPFCEGIVPKRVPLTVPAPALRVAVLECDGGAGLTFKAVCAWDESVSSPLGRVDLVARLGCCDILDWS